MLMLQFAYRFLKKYIRKECYEICYGDTDSVWICLSKKSLLEACKPEMKSEFLLHTEGSCFQKCIVTDKGEEKFVPNLDLEVRPPTDYFLNGYKKNDIVCSDYFIVRSCCKDHEKLDNKTLSLMKVEYVNSSERGDFWALSSKCYLADGPESKLGCKGIRKSTFTNRVETFKSVFEDKLIKSSTNRGFIKDKKTNTMRTYVCQRFSFSFLNAKRNMLDSTRSEPLDIVLMPCRLIDEKNKMNKK